MTDGLFSLSIVYNFCLSVFLSLMYRNLQCVCMPMLCLLDLLPSPSSSSFSPPLSFLSPSSVVWNILSPSLTFIFVISSAWQLHLLLMLVFLPFISSPSSLSLLFSIALWEKRKEIGRFIIIATLSIGRRRESVIASLMQSCLPFSHLPRKDEKTGREKWFPRSSWHRKEKEERWCNHDGE